MKVLISGSRGFIGEALVKRLDEQGHKVTRLVRNRAEDGDVIWNAKTGALDLSDIEGFDAVVHLGGVGLGEKRWTEKERGAIWDSRINTTDFLAQRLAQAINRPKVFVVASGIGYYGDRADEKLNETSTKGDGFLAEVVKHWEEAAAPAVEAGIRTVHVRSGIVLGAKGGMYKRLAPVFKGALGGNLGDGNQYMSWISLEDEVNAIIFAITNDRLSGPVNFCSPNPVTNKEFTKAMGEALHRPTFIPVWPWMLKIAFGSQQTNEMLLVSQRAYPKKLENAGFKFHHKHINAVLKDLVAEAEPAPRPQPEATTGKKKKRNRTPKMFRFDEPTKPVNSDQRDVDRRAIDEDIIDLSKPDDHG